MNPKKYKHWKLLVLQAVLVFVLTAQPAVFSSLGKTGLFMGTAEAAESENSDKPGLELPTLRIISTEGSGDDDKARVNRDLTSPVGLPVKFDVTEIAPLTGFSRSRGLGLNNSGQVVGSFYDFDTTQGRVGERAYIWERSAGAAILSTLSGRSEAWEISDTGFAAGWSHNARGVRRAVRWDTSGSSIVDIGALANTQDPSLVGDFSEAYDVDRQGAVVGYAEVPTADSGSYIHAFLYDDANGIQDLGTLVTGVSEKQNGDSIAWKMNENGEVVGTANANIDPPVFRPFIYDSVAGMVELAIDDGYSGGQWYATAINDQGVIGGHVVVGENQHHIYYWENSASSPVAIDMSAGFPYAEIYAVNKDNLMVGVMWDSQDTEHAFLFHPERGVIDLNDLVSYSSGWLLESATDINDSGQIVGRGQLNEQFRAFLLDPVEGVYNPGLPLLLLDD